MDVSEAVDRLHAAQAAAGRGRIAAPRAGVEDRLAQLAAAIAPLRLPADLVAFWRAVDPETLNVAPCPRPVGPERSLQLWRGHLAAAGSLHRFLPWCYETADFMLIELDQPGAPDTRPEAQPTSQPKTHENGCYSWAGDNSPLVSTFCSVTAYLDLLATMLELHESAPAGPVEAARSDPPRAHRNTVSVVRAAAADELRGVERATRRGDLRTAVRLATPLYDRLFRTPAPAQARAIRPVG